MMKKHYDIKILSIIGNLLWLLAQKWAKVFIVPSFGLKFDDVTPCVHTWEFFNKNYLSLRDHERFSCNTHMDAICRLFLEYPKTLCFFRLCQMFIYFRIDPSIGRFPCSMESISCNENSGF